MMTLDPEYLLLAGIVLSLTALVWFTPLRRSVFVAPSKAAARSPPRNRPVRLMAAQPYSGTTAGVSQGQGIAVEDAGVATHKPSTDTLVSPHMARLQVIVTVTLDTAHLAQRLHKSAHEQVDGAHYALQNLLNELSSVMSIAGPVQPDPGVTVLHARPQHRPTYQTALAA